MARKSTGRRAFGRAEHSVLALSLGAICAALLSGCESTTIPVVSPPVVSWSPDHDTLADHDAVAKERNRIQKE